MYCLDERRDCAGGGRAAAAAAVATAVNERGDLYNNANATSAVRPYTPRHVAHISRLQNRPPHRCDARCPIAIEYQHSVTHIFSTIQPTKSTMFVLLLYEW